MKKALIYISVVALLGGAGWLGYLWWQNSRINLWTFVPDTALAVYEPVNLGSLFDAEEERKILLNLKSLSGVSDLQKEFDILDSLAGQNRPLSDLLSKSDMLMSIHHGDLSATSLTSLFLIEVKDLDVHDYFSAVQDFLVNTRGFKAGSRNYQGYVINEFNDGDTQLAYIFYKNFLIASFSSFLVDDAIRMLEKDRESQFNTNKELMQAKSQNLFGEGRLYIQQNRLSRLIGRLQANQERDASIMEWFSELMYLDLAVDDDRIDMTGFAVLDTAKSNYLQALQGVRGATFSMKNVIPDHAALVVHLSFDDADRMLDGLRNFWREHKPDQLTGLGELENRYDFERAPFFDLVDQEVGLFVLDSKRSFAREKILAVQHEDHILAESILRKLANESRGEAERFDETYAGRRIGLIKISEVPSRLFGDMFSGFDEAYFFVDGSYFFIGNSLHALQVQIDDMDAENTWRKSLRTNKFLATTNDDANFSIMVKGPGVWDIVTETVREDWRKTIEDNSIVFQQIEYGAMQFTNVDENFYTNITIHHPGKLVQMQDAKSFEVQQTTDLEFKLTTKPYGVRNHNDRSLEMLVQDSAFNVHLVSAEGEDVLRIPLNEPIVSNVHQVDYYKNGKLQYLFALPHSIHMIDRTGRYIPGYPVKVPSDQPVKFLSLIDYDGKKDYRIMAATEKSYYYLFDRTGRLLKGWNPKKLTGGPAMPGQHLRVRSSDFMLFIQANGTVHGLTRKGHTKKGFPLDLKGNVTGPMYINKGSSLATTELVAVTENGDLIEFNLLGTVIRRDQFYKDDITDQFKLVTSHDGKKYIVVKETSRTVSVFNDNLEELFKVDKRTSDLSYQYYNFGSGNELVAVIDQVNALTNLYSLEGIKLHKEPLNTGHALAILYHEVADQYEIYCSTDNQLKRLTLQR